MDNNSADHNRFSLTGTVTKIYDPQVRSERFRKQEFSIRFSDVNFFNNKVVERIVKFSLLNEKMDFVKNMNVDDQVEVSFYIDGRDYVNQNTGKENNFTSLTAIDIDWIFKSEPKSEASDNKSIFDRKEEEDKKAVLGSLDDDFDILSNPEKALEAEKEKEKGINDIRDNIGGEEQKENGDEDDKLKDFENPPF